MKLEIYQHLLEINAGFDQVVRGLDALRKHDAFSARVIEQYLALAKESRASTNSYLLGIVELAETKEGGRRFGKRRDRELREE